MNLKFTLVATAGLLGPACVLSQSEPPAETAQTITLPAQADATEWEQNERFRRFYELSIEMLRSGTEELDIQDYEQRSYAIFREFAISIGADPDGMVDHLRNIPREMVVIVRRDPTVLDSYENFNVALRGPK